MIIFGIDPGYATTGFGIIKTDGQDIEVLDFGAITTTPDISKNQRIRQTIEDLLSLFQEYRPDQIAIEELFFSKNVKTAMQVSESRGAMLYEITRQNLPVYEYKPNQVKNNLCGNGSAPKEQIQKMVQIILNLQEIPKPDDAADALAIAICHANHLKNQNLTYLND
ncbi:crossover junction endodeoxyribonuclease RuvC [Candidatus Peregrinibacteria bacterium]|nr:crossover junction endodeoxyribonuclease RuvC [Candidatus Peregrinibacteria bacterium]